MIGSCGSIAFNDETSSSFVNGYHIENHNDIKEEDKDYDSDVDFINEERSKFFRCHQSCIPP